MINTGKAEGKFFVDGAISSDFITRFIQEHAADKSTGAYSIFIGQVRHDEIANTRVKAIDYTAHAEMVLEKFEEIRTGLFARYPINALHVYHSVGLVAAGDICFFVLAASGHRHSAIRACEEAVNLVKSELPIWGKLLLENNGSEWKENHPS